MRRQDIFATSNPARAVDGVGVVGSFQSWPATDRPWKVRGRSDTPRTVRHVEIALTTAEAARLVRDWHSMGLVSGDQAAA